MIRREFSLGGCAVCTQLGYCERDIRGDRTAIELFIACVDALNTVLRRCLELK